MTTPSRSKSSATTSDAAAVIRSFFESACTSAYSARTDAASPEKCATVYAAPWRDEASFARTNSRQPGTCSTVNPWSRIGPLNSYLRNRLMYRS
jgi:hypothetical protein